MFAEKLAAMGFGVTCDPADDISVVVADAASFRYAPEGVLLFVVGTGGVADWAVKRARPDAEVVAPSEVVDRVGMCFARVQQKQGAENRPPGRGLVVSYANKGGAGKTTVAIATALTLAAGGVRTVLWDVDFGGPNVAEFFGLEPKGDIGDVLAGADLSDILVSVRENLWVLPGPRGARPLRVSAPEMDAVLDRLLGDFQIVVADTAPEPWEKPHLFGVFARADLILAVVDQSKFSMEETEKYAPTIVAMGADIARVKIVVNRYNRKLTSLKEIERHFCAGFRKDVGRLPRVFAVIPDAWLEHARGTHRGEIPPSPEWARLAREAAGVCGVVWNPPFEEGKKRGLFAWLKK